MTRAISDRSAMPRVKERRKRSIRGGNEEGDVNRTVTGKRGLLSTTSLNDSRHRRNNVRFAKKDRQLVQEYNEDGTSHIQSVKSLE
jgi:hypothetical protein